MSVCLSINSTDHDETSRSCYVLSLEGFWDSNSITSRGKGVSGIEKTANLSVRDSDLVARTFLGPLSSTKKYIHRFIKISYTEGF